jgi:hypothetical protein
MLNSFYSYFNNFSNTFYSYEYNYDDQINESNHEEFNSMGNKNDNEPGCKEVIIDITDDIYDQNGSVVFDDFLLDGNNTLNNEFTILKNNDVGNVSLRNFRCLKGIDASDLKDLIHFISYIKNNTQENLDEVSSEIKNTISNTIRETWNKAENIFFVGDYLKWLRENPDLIRQSTGLSFVWGGTVLAAWMESPVATALFGAVAAKCTNGALINQSTPKKAAIAAGAFFGAYILEKSLKNTGFNHVSFMSMSFMLLVEFSNRIVKDSMSNYELEELIQTISDSNEIPKETKEHIKENASSFKEVWKDLKAVMSSILEEKVIKTEKNEEGTAQIVTKSPAFIKKVGVVALTTLIGIFGTKLFTNSLSWWAFSKLNNLTIVRVIKDYPFIVKYGITAGLIGGGYTFKDWNPVVYQKKIGLGMQLFKRDVNGNFGINMNIYEDDEDEKAVEPNQVVVFEELPTEYVSESWYGWFKDGIKKRCQHITHTCTTVTNTIKKQILKVTDCASQYTPKFVANFLVNPTKDGKPAIGKCGAEALTGNVVAGIIIKNADNGSMLNMMGYDLSGIYLSALFNRFSILKKYLATGTLVLTAVAVDKFVLSAPFFGPIAVISVGEIARIDLKKWTKSDKLNKTGKKKKKDKKTEGVKAETKNVELEDKNITNQENINEEIKIEKN